MCPPVPERLRNVRDYLEAVASCLSLRSAIQASTSFIGQNLPRLRMHVVKVHGACGVFSRANTPSPANTILNRCG